MATDTVDEPIVETRTPMTWEQYVALEDGHRGEYFGGSLVAYGMPSHRHQDIVYELTHALKQACPAGARVVGSWGWSPEGAREELGPDVMVHTSTEDKRLTAPPPLLVVEVLSSNWRTDVVEKPPRYARWGARSMWIADPRERELATFELRDGMFHRTAHHDRGVVLARYGDVDVTIDIDALFA